jgi:hypothetical protein
MVSSSPPEYPRRGLVARGAALRFHLHPAPLTLWYYRCLKAKGVELLPTRVEHCLGLIRRGATQCCILALPAQSPKINGVLDNAASRECCLIDSLLIGNTGAYIWTMIARPFATPVETARPFSGICIFSFPGLRTVLLGSHYHIDVPSFTQQQFNSSLCPDSIFTALPREQSPARVQKGPVSDQIRLPAKL